MTVTSFTHLSVSKYRGVNAAALRTKNRSFSWIRIWVFRILSRAKSPHVAWNLPTRFLLMSWSRTFCGEIKVFLHLCENCYWTSSWSCVSSCRSCGFCNANHKFCVGIPMRTVSRRKNFKISLSKVLMCTESSIMTVNAQLWKKSISDMLLSFHQCCFTFFLPTSNLTSNSSLQESEEWSSEKAAFEAARRYGEPSWRY